MIDKECVPKKVRELKRGDRVDLGSCPYLHNHPLAEFEYAVVDCVIPESDTCWVVYYNEQVAGYDPDQVLMTDPHHPGT